MRNTIAAIAVIGGSVAAVYFAVRRGTRTLGEVEGRREMLSVMPKNWWMRKTPKRAKVCYRSKADALNVFREYNRDVIDNYGGESAQHTPSEFDALNLKHDLSGKNRVRTIAEALWISIPAVRPFCLDEIDIDTLNETAVGRGHHIGFRLPDFVEEAEIQKQETEYWQRFEPAPVPF